MANKYYFGLSVLFKSKLFLKRLKISSNRVLIRLGLALYAQYETQATTKINEKKLGVFKRKILWKIADQKRMKIVNLKLEQMNS